LVGALPVRDSEEIWQAHHLYPFTLGVKFVGAVVSIPTSVADDVALVRELASVATATTS
jgi:hypothetical protein